MRVKQISVDMGTERAVGTEWQHCSTGCGLRREVTMVMDTTQGNGSVPMATFLMWHGNSQQDERQTQSVPLAEQKLSM